MLVKQHNHQPENLAVPTRSGQRRCAGCHSSSSLAERGRTSFLPSLPLSLTPSISQSIRRWDATLQRDSSGLRREKLTNERTWTQTATNGTQSGWELFSGFGNGYRRPLSSLSDFSGDFLGRRLDATVAAATAEEGPHKSRVARRTEADRTAAFPVSGSSVDSRV